jgi:hypothetical protein
MSSILYYSNYCENSKKILSLVTKSSLKKDIHFICIDKRVQKNNNTYIILENNQEIILPPTIQAVPALLLITQNYKVLLGNDILEHLKPVEEVQMQKATNFNGEPNAFSINTGSISGVVSDNYSYLDQNSDELSAKGDGGLRQLYNYATINHSDTIETPEENYVPNKVNEENVKDYEAARNNIT